MQDHPKILFHLQRYLKSTLGLSTHRSVLSRTHSYSPHREAKHRAAVSEILKHPWVMVDGVSIALSAADIPPQLHEQVLFEMGKVRIFV